MLKAFILILLIHLLLFKSVSTTSSPTIITNDDINFVHILTNYFLNKIEARMVDVSYPIIINNQSICASPSVHYERIALGLLENIAAHVRNYDKSLAYWNSNEKCFKDNLTNKCFLNLGTYFTDCMNNELLTLLPTRTSFYYLEHIDRIRSDSLLLLTQVKKIIRIAIDIQIFTESGAGTLQDGTFLAQKLDAYKLEIRSANTFFNEIVKRYRDLLLLYTFQVQDEYFVAIDQSVYEQLITGVKQGFGVSLDTYKNYLLSLKQKASTIGTKIQSYDKIVSFLLQIYYIDNQVSTVTKVMGLVEACNLRTCSIYNSVTDLTSLSTKTFAMEVLMPLDIPSSALLGSTSFDFAISRTPLIDFSRMEYTLGNQRYIFSVDGKYKGSFWYNLQVSSSKIFTCAFTLDYTYFPYLVDSTKLIYSTSAPTSTTTSTSSASTIPTTSSGVSRDTFTSNASLSNNKRSLLSYFTGRKLLANNLPSYNCPAGRYGPECKLAYAGTYSPGDGLLYVCSNGPEGEIQYIGEGSTNSDCSFKCLNPKHHRVGNTCQYPDIGYYPLDGTSEVKPCSSYSNAFAFISPGTVGDPTSCTQVQKEPFSVSYNLGQLTTRQSFSIEIDLLLDSKLIPNYFIGYGIVSIENEWVWQAVINKGDNSMYMEVKKFNSTPNDPKLITVAFPLDFNWHSYSLQFNYPSQVLSIYRDMQPIGSSLFSFNYTSSVDNFLVGGAFKIVKGDFPPVYYLWLGSFKNVKLYDQLIDSWASYSSKEVVCPSGTLFKGGKCISLSCQTDNFIVDSNQCICPWGRYKDGDDCEVCPYSSTIGSSLPREQLKDCQCSQSMIFSYKNAQCVQAQPSLYPPLATFKMTGSYGPYKALEDSILSQFFYPVGETVITLAPNYNQTVYGDEVYSIKLIKDGNNVLFSYDYDKNQLTQFKISSNETGDYDLIVSTERDGHRAGFTSKISYHIRERDLKPLIVPKPSDGEFDSPFQIRILPPYRSKPSIIILCYGSNELNVTCVEYDDKKQWVFGPPVYLKVFSYGTLFSRLPGEIISFFYPRTITKAQQMYYDNQKEWKSYLEEKEKVLKEKDQIRKASTMYRLFNPFNEWFNTYPSYLWFPIVCAFCLVIFIIVLFIARFYFAKRINKKRKLKIKKYLRQQKEMEKYLNQFLPPPYKYKVEEDNEKKKKKKKKIVESNEATEEMNRSLSDNQNLTVIDNNTENITAISDTPPIRDRSNSIVEDEIDNDEIQLLDIQVEELGATSKFNNLFRQNNSLQEVRTPQRNETRKPKPLPQLPTNTSDMKRKKLSSRSSNGPKFILCGQCGDIARFWCKGCNNYLCLECEMKDSVNHNNRKSRIMICDHCLQQKPQLREYYLKKNERKYFGCKQCLDLLIDEKKIKQVGVIIKRCTKCFDEQISQESTEPLCDNCKSYNLNN
ncbi:hypothetical protein ABK040_010292 [Willaertia magna]